MPTIISLCGGSSTGKTSRIAPFFSNHFPSPSVILHQDPFRSLTSHLSFSLAADDPDAYQTEYGLEVIHAFRKRQPIKVPIWHLYETPQGLKRYVGEKTLIPAETFIFEGMYTAYGSLSQAADFTIYVEAPAWTRYIRRILRNWLERKTSTPTKVSKGFFHYVLPAHHLYVISQKKHADLIVSLPYCFSSSIRKFQLVPILSQYSSSQTFSTIPLETNTYFQLLQNPQHPFIVQLIHKEQLYIEFPIDKEDAVIFLSTNWHSL